MKRFFFAGLLGAFLQWAAFPIGAQEFRDTRLQRIADPLRIQFPSTEPARSDEVMRATLRTAATLKGWRVESDTPSRMELSLVVRDRHKARVELTYLGTGYLIRYLGSDELLYDGNATGTKGPARAIHANYNVWVRELAQSINAGLGTSALVEVPAPFAAAPVAALAAAAPAASKQAAEGMPAPGTSWKYGFRDRQYDRRELFFTIEVVGVDDTRVRERTAVDGGDLSEVVIEADRHAFRIRQIAPSASFVELAPYPRELRKASQPPDGYPAPNSTMWKIGAPKYVEEDVQVPAGTFKALRVEVQGTASAFGSAYTSSAARFVYVAWYVPELNRYVRIHHQTWNRQNSKIGDEYVQLVAYKPGK